jgi:hypothetical protein
MDTVSLLVTLFGGGVLTTLGVLKLYGINKNLLQGSGRTLKENLCGT